PLPPPRPSQERPTSKPCTRQPRKTARAYAPRDKGGAGDSIAVPPAGKTVWRWAPHPAKAGGRPVPGSLMPSIRQIPSPIHYPDAVRWPNAFTDNEADAQDAPVRYNLRVPSHLSLHGRPLHDPKRPPGRAGAAGRSGRIPADPAPPAQ